MSEKIYAMIPARGGSTRLAMKNLALIDGNPMIYYAINSAKETGVFDKIIVNSDHNIFSEIATRYNVDFYLRPKDLGSTKTKSDDVVINFINSFEEADYIVWVNPIAPFQTSTEIKNAVNYFINNNLDSMITAEEKQVHCIFEDIPVNFEKEGLFAQTQDLIPVKSFAYSVMMWRAKRFAEEYSSKGRAFFCGKFGTFPVGKKTAWKVNFAEDLLLADLVMSAQNRLTTSKKVLYDVCLKNLNN